MSSESVSRRRHRRVVALSAQDRERLERGESLEAQQRVDALTARSGGVLPETGAADCDAVWGDAATRGQDANDARLLGDVPPHW